MALLRGKQLLVEQLHGQPPHGSAAQGPDPDLLRQQQRDVDRLAAQQRDGYTGEHVAHGVVGAGLDLQKGVRMVLQCQFLGAQDAEHRRGVGGGDHRADEKALQPRQGENEVGEYRYSACGPRYPQGGQHHSGGQHRPGYPDVGAEAAVKHDEDQADGAHRINRFIVVERYLENTILTKEHAQADENQQ